MESGSARDREHVDRAPIEELPEEVRSFLEEHGCNKPGHPWTIGWVLVWCVREILKLRAAR